MKHRFLSILLVLALVLGMFSATTGLAAGSVEEALSEVDIYNGGVDLYYLYIDGKVQEQKYTYYNYTSQDGTIKEIPAYCVNPNRYGGSPGGRPR